VVQAGASLAEVEVEPLVLPVGVGAEVGGEPTAAADADAGVEVDRWVSHPVFKPKPNAHSMCAQESSLHTYRTENGDRITNVSI
jgi:hypothetical protein